MAQAQIVIALDPGHKKTGVAIGNRLTNTARPLLTVKGSFDEQVKRIAEICAEWRPGLLLVGLAEKERAERAWRYSQKLARSLETETGIEIRFADEAYTTQAAKAQGATSDTDAAAACLLATDWLNARDSSR